MFGIDDAIMAAGVSAAGGVIGNLISADSASSAQDFSAQQYATRYQTTVKDLQAAGLSPMLAYSQGAGSAPTGVSFQGQNPFAGVPSAYASTKNLEPQAEQLISSASASRGQAAVADATVRKIDQEISNLGTEQARSLAVIDNLHEERQNLIKQGYNLTEQGNVLASTLRKMDSEITNLNWDAVLKELSSRLSGFDVQAATESSNLGRRAGQWKPFADILLKAIGAFKH